MLIKTFKMQYNTIIERKNFYILFLMLFGYMLLNFLYNVFKYAGRDVADMYHPMRLLLLANGSPFYHFLMLFYPIIVIIPAAFSYIYDQDCNEQVFILSRAGKINYYLAKMAATFWTTFLAFSIPFLTEIILNCIVFPGKAAGLLSNVSKYQIPELEAVHKLLLPSVYSYSICIYVIIFTVMFGIASGILATFALAVSIAIKLKYKAFLFLPVYILVYILNEMSDIIPQINFSTNYYFYFDIFNITAKSFIGYLMCLLSIAGLSIVLVVYKARKDSI